MTNLEQAIINKIHRFPPEKQKKMLDYAESLEDSDDIANANHRTTWEIIKDLAEKVPDEAWDEIPSDASLNVDHYLYGHRKKSK